MAKAEAGDLKAEVNLTSLDELSRSAKVF
jgi:hypothetical protein